MKAVVLAAVPGSVGVNSRAAIERRFREGKIPRLGVIAMTPARAIYSYLTQFLIAGILLVVGVAHPLQASRGWWTVWGTLVDIACLISLTVLVKREGIKLFDLVGTARAQLRRDLLLVPPFLVALLVPALVLGTVIQRAFYPTATVGPQIAVLHGLPGWAILYGLVVWPVIWTFTEEVTYLGYLFPRLEGMTRSTTWAAVIVLAFWTIQHPALPLIGGNYPAFRAITAFIAVGVQTSLFMWKRRLLPLIITHWIADLSPAISALLFVH